MPAVPERDASGHFEITFLHGAGEDTTRTVDAAELRSLVGWAGRMGVRVCIRPRAPYAVDGGQEEDTERRPESDRDR
ncbi:hypothetical protein [Streptomyces nanshensis]|uniref:Uncharacterized protein n=1 Tax=Streptomyces nanshensis TaxID=518642 RepID=A0A1E7KXT2_9ACTN|nr:hypothetical protein [Streptomyces nanshensis]OEV08715.1 hypothetical protein AN218_25270 [Streptomyces nanshensis]